MSKVEGRCLSVVLQERAESTRLLILDAGAEVFTEAGYGNAKLSDVVARAGVSRGAFSYHFPTKESLATALIEYSETAMMGRALSEASESASPLENLIRSSFAQVNMVQHDAKVAVGLQLALALDQVSDTTMRDIAPRWTSMFETAFDAAVAAGDLKPDVDGRTVGYSMWCSLVGNNMMAAASGKRPIEGLALLWQVHLRGTVAARSASYFEQLLRRVAAQYAP